MSISTETSPQASSQASSPPQDLGPAHLESPRVFHNDAFFRDPYATFAALRRQGPVNRLNFWGGLHHVGGYDDVATHVVDRRLSHDLSRFWAQQFSPAENAQLVDFARLFGLWMAHYDGPRHTRLRGALNKALSRVLQTKQAEVVAVIERQVTKLPEGEPVDVIQRFAYPLPALVIAALLDIEPGHFDTFIRCADNLVEMTGTTRADFGLAMRTQASLVELTAYLEELIARRRASAASAPDLISALIAADTGEGPLTTEEIHGQCTMMLFAGHETTRNLIGNGVLSLLQHPAELAALRAEPALLRGTLEEILRYQSPVQLTVREALEDFELLGTAVKKGEYVMFNFGSANHDERKFTAPARFDIRRREERNMGFGIGPHTCVGARLAFLEGELAFSRLLSRFSSWELATQEPDWHHNAGFRGLRALPVVFRS